MLAAGTRSALARANLTRGFATTTRAAQAAPLQKPVVEKEFKIYRWVRVYFLSVCERECSFLLIGRV
jgi:hypothetical protein